MASLTILYWRDIPSQVIVKIRTLRRQARTVRALHPGDRRGGDARAREERRRLSRRMAARASRSPCGDDLEAEAAAAAARLEAEYDTHRLALLAKHNGRDNARVTTLLTPSAFEPRGKRPPPDRKPRMRLWSVRHAALDGAPLCAASRPRSSAPAPLFARIGYRPPRAPGRRARGRRQGLPVRLPDVRRLRPVEDRHVLPDELPEGACATAPAAASGPTAIAKSIPRCPASG